ncbi:MAG: DUF975 family protein [Lachnospiraceae bacterium]|nr:DUF975 family protein [Lachnospiraceae bacterium]
MGKEEFKALKKEGRKVFHANYLLFTFLCLISALFGIEGTFAVTAMNMPAAIVERINKSEEEQDSNEQILTADDVFRAIARGEFGEGLEKSRAILDNIEDTVGGNEFLGTTRGVLAEILNARTADVLDIKLISVIRNLTGSDSAARVIFIIIHILWAVLLFIFIKNVFAAILRRLFLIARLYDKMPFSDAIHFARVRRWCKASWTMFVKALFHLLWTLTIAGYFIKYYSYYAVPYIVAENPDIGPMEALTLSRKMMDGHKMEAFKYDLSFIGWFLLMIATAGISDVVYGFPYRMSCRSEYYVRLRSLALETGVEGAEKLNDRYLFEKGDKILLYETYFDVVDRQTYIYENDIKLSKFRQFTTKWLGLWPGSLDDKDKYEELQAIKYKMYYDLKRRDGRAYPTKLNPLYREKKKKKAAKPFHFLRSYTVWSLMLMFIIFAFLGWVWEVVYVMMRGGGFVNRGVLHGPWLPIYGVGGVVALVICSRLRKHPVKEFFFSVLVCGILEYFGGWMLEMLYNERWWSYDGYFLNLHGRICAEGLFIFGVGCMLIIYLVAPALDYLISKMKNWLIIALAVVLMTVFLGDVIYSSKNPNKAEGAIEAVDTESETDSGALPESGSAVPERE